MTKEADRLAAKIESIVEQGGSKSDRARELFALGCDRTDVVELLDMSYSQAHSLWKRMQEGNTGETWQPSYRGRAKASDVEAEARRQNNIQLSPTQIRYVTQEGHRVVKEDTERGPECKRCGAHLSFSLVYLAFVHTFSKEEPTAIEDKYPGQEVVRVR